MATKRMFHAELIESDEFFALSTAAQNLYFHLGLRTDDEGFIAGCSFTLLRTHATQEDLQQLVRAGFIISFPDSRVLLMRHFYLNNDLRRNRWRPTIHAEERRQVYLHDKVYHLVDALHPTDAQPTPPPAALAPASRLVADMARQALKADADASPASAPQAASAHAAPSALQTASVLQTASALQTASVPAPADMRLPMLMTMLQRTGISEALLRSAMECYGFERVYEATRRICARELEPTGDALMSYLAQAASA